jgi:hypothetical protein
MPTGGTEAHATHFREQESGGCTYLTGWLNDVPVASCVVRWNGCHAPQVRLAFPVIELSRRHGDSVPASWATRSSRLR